MEKATESHPVAFGKCFALSEQTHLLDLLKFACLNLVQINPAGYRVAAIVATVPSQCVKTGLIW